MGKLHMHDPHDALHCGSASQGTPAASPHCGLPDTLTYSERIVLDGREPRRLPSTIIRTYPS
jgi:hypothetical protein